MTRIQFIQYTVFLITVVAAARAGYLIKQNTPEVKIADPVFPPPTAPVSGSGNNLQPAIDFIAAVGVIEASTEDIAIATQMPGVVEKVFVQPGSTVSEGDELFRIDTRTKTSLFHTAQAQLESADAQLTELESQISINATKVQAAQALLNAAKTQVDDLKQQSERSEKLFASKAVTAEYTDSRQFAYQVAVSEQKNREAILAEAVANLKLLQGEGVYPEAPDGPKLKAQRALVEVARSQVAEAQSQLDQCMIRAPINGTVLKVNVRPGEFAPTGMLADPLIVMGSINPLHIRAEIDEADIPSFDSKNKAFVSLRGQPLVRVEVQFVRLEPLVVPKRILTSSISERIDTRVMQLIYQLDPQSLKAYPGQQVDMFIEQTPKSH